MHRPDGGHDFAVASVLPLPGSVWPSPGPGSSPRGRGPGQDRGHALHSGRDPRDVHPPQRGHATGPSIAVQTSTEHAPRCARSSIRIRICDARFAVAGHARPSTSPARLSRYDLRSMVSACPSTTPHVVEAAPPPESRAELCGASAQRGHPGRSYPARPLAVPADLRSCLPRGRSPRATSPKTCPMASTSQVRRHLPDGREQCYRNRLRPERWRQ